MLPKKLENIFKAHLIKAPGSYKIPEPPRGNSIRIYNPRLELPFTVIGEPVDRWVSLAKQLDLTKNYWEKTPISDEQLWIYNTRLYLIPATEDKYFEAWPGAIKVGSAIFAEDQYAQDILARARELGEMQLQELRLTYQDKLILGVAGIDPMPQVIKRRGRPRKEKANESK